MYNDEYKNNYPFIMFGNNIDPSLFSVYTTTKCTKHQIDTPILGIHLQVKSSGQYFHIFKICLWLGTKNSCSSIAYLRLFPRKKYIQRKKYVQLFTEFTLLFWHFTAAFCAVLWRKEFSICEQQKIQNFKKFKENNRLDWGTNKSGHYFEFVLFHTLVTWRTLQTVLWVGLISEPKRKRDVSSIVYHHCFEFY